MIFDSFWGRLGVVWGAVLDSKIDPKIFHAFTPRGLDFDLVIDWSQDSLNTVPRGLLGSSWGGLGPLLGALGPSLEGLGGF